ncbi:hypothetical protein MA04_03714 [Alcanivorax balearicus MACL04]|uniref:Peptidoglycan binding-like domain-containing protein n=1 Tax=Alloalcanivorax balearicus MACL04 TaxID=1177182 RepID=A0ABT2R3U3_9GAMM|nr:peptidoglycan-binding protein [Alloalcanivorax balearicus]MCU5784414.1 hypothetical protein [Alloalcanivorax balearicus MACL04]
MKSSLLLLPLAAAILATGCASQQTTTMDSSTDNQRLRQLEQENQQLRAQLGNEQPASASQAPDLLPPNAKPGHCYARVVIPETYKTEMERVMVSAEDTKLTTTPARYETVHERVLVREATTKLITKPAEYRTVSEQVLVRPAYTTWKKGRGPIERIDQATGEIMCLVEVPAEYKTVQRKELVQPERVEEVTIPAEYKTIEVVKQVEPPQTHKQVIPAQYRDVPKQVKVTDADMEWREILCETNTTPDVVRRLQQALKDEGYDPTWVDGVYGSRTRAAVVAYQKDNNLPSGQLTMRTLNELGVQL